MRAIIRHNFFQRSLVFAQRIWPEPRRSRQKTVQKIINLLPCIDHLTVYT